MVNKLIVVVVVGLVAGGIGVAYALATTLPQVLSQPTEGLPTMAPVLPTETRAPTPTTAFIVLTNPAVPTVADPTMSVSMQIAAATESATVSPSGPTPSPLTCIPNHAAETGRVVEVVDGNTIRVYMEDKIYFVRYIGIAVPRYDQVKQLYGDAATFKNSGLVYGKEVSLIRDVSDKDAAGRLLRYVLVGNTFVNLELIRLGMATAADVAPDSACAGEFKLAEQSARQAQVGRWSGTPTPLPTVP